ncbi:hypothetical protein GGI19_001976 [Coemansia pectinata]|uniref:Protein PBN1 n=1 Tax=Coemansia pectinata TaxID=1052879 RepID=A0A9W8LCZ2_9FUNG|nr:hypothetical protein GGI19_001976 [Coemansia pectinata]
MRRPLNGQITPSASVFETEDHVIFGQHISVQSSSDKSWNIDTIGGSWHVWHQTTIFDRIDLPLWPDSMLEARVVLTSEMCRDRILLPPAPFMPPRGLEYCGAHIAATAKPDATSDTSNLDLARSHMQNWMAELMGWTSSSSNSHKPTLLAPGQGPHTKAESYDESPLGPLSFVDLGNSSIYYFNSFDAQALDVNRPGSRLDLARFALGSEHPLRTLIDPHVVHQDKNWLDNHRIEISLHRTPEGFVKASVQVLSLMHPASGISIVPLPNATSRIAWIGPTKQHESYIQPATDRAASLLTIPDEFYAEHDTTTQSAGIIDVRTSHFNSFHPSLIVSAHADANTPLTSDLCHLDTIVMLPRTYFFDPYQLYELRHQLNVRYEHYGPIELERPAEVMPNWGSLLHLNQRPHSAALNATIPIHARYRLPPIAHEHLVGYHGEPSGDSHIDLALLPPLSAVVCPVDSSKPRHNAPSDKGSILRALDMRLVLFDELGLWPVAALEPSPDAETLLRMPVGYVNNTGLIQVLTLVALFVGTVSICLTVKKSLASRQQ